jgi:hypothetical protein
MRFTRHGWLGMFCAAALAFPGSAQNLTWAWSNPQPHGNDVVDMAWNGTLGVQVCERGQIYTSPDLINWTPQNSHLTNDLQAVTFFGNRIIVTGAFGAVAYSDDGVNFTTNSLNTTNWLVSVAASSNLVVTVGDNGALFTSTNGAAWTLQEPPPFLTEDGYWLLSVAWGGGVFVTTGEGGYIATSSNGVIWTSRSLAADYGDFEKVVWVNSSGSIAAFPYAGFWAVSDNDSASGQSYVFHSTNNGVVWNQVSFATPPTNTLYTFAADTTTGLLAGDSEVRLGTPIGREVVWPEQIGATTNDAPEWTYFASVLQTNGVYALAGYDGQLVESSPAASGGYDWNTPYFSSRDWLWQVTQAGGLYVAVGDNARIMTSGDGADWTVEEVPDLNSVSTSNTVFLCVGGTTNLLLAAGNDGSLALSPNALVPVVDTNLDGSLSTNLASSLGIVWYPQPAPVGTTNDLAGVCLFSNKYYLVGGNGTVLNSANGTNWSKQASGTTNDLTGITGFTNGLLVATGDYGTLLTSTNGTNWSKQSSGTTNGLSRVQCFSGRLLTFGENGVLLTSTNATNWVALSSGVTNWLNDAVMISNTCFVVGNQGVVLACTNFSTNYAHWNRVVTITTKALESAATQNGQLVVAGFEGSILRSQVLPVTTPVNFTGYSQASGYNVYSVQGVVDQQFTLDSSTNLFNWVTGPVLDLIYGDGSLIFYQSVPTNHPPRTQFYRCTLVP